MPSLVEQFVGSIRSNHSFSSPEFTPAQLVSKVTNGYGKPARMCSSKVTHDMGNLNGGTYFYAGRRN